MVNHFTKTIHHHQHFFHHHHYFFLLESPSACRESKLFLTLPGNNVNKTLPFQKRTVGRRKKSSRMSFLDFKWLNFLFSKQLNQAKGTLVDMVMSDQTCPKRAQFLSLSFFLNEKNQHGPFHWLLIEIKEIKQSRNMIGWELYKNVINTPF